MNELEMLMIAESKKNAIDEDVIKRAQKEEYEKARKWKKDNTEKVGFVGNEPILVRQENDNKLLVRFLGDAWCPDVVEEWVKRIEHDKNNDVDYVIDTYMFGVIENDRERKSSDFHVSFYYRG